MRFLVFALALGASLVRLAHASTFATFQTSVGSFELQFFDEEKPVTVSNFLKYATSGRFDRQFIQRWEPNFVIQGGGYYVTNKATNTEIAVMPVFGTITNEYSVGARLSNTYGTIAMARQEKGTNSATSQWFINLKDNRGLDAVDGGFTVFGQVTSGTNVLNLFVPPPPTNGIYLYQAGGALNTLPTLSPAPSYDDLVYVKLHLRRDLNLKMGRTFRGDRTVSWNSVAGVTNVLEYTTSDNVDSWTVYTNIVGTGSVYTLIEPSTDPRRIYRVKLFY